MHTLEITQGNLDATLKNNDIVLLDFWASWCGPCRMFGPIFEKSAAKHPDIAFGKVNTEEQSELAGAFQIRSIPTLMAFRQGVLLFSQPGVLPEEALDELIGQLRALDMKQIHEKIAQENAKAPVS